MPKLIMVLLLHPDSPIDEVIEDIKHLINSLIPKLSMFPHSAKQIIASMEAGRFVYPVIGCYWRHFLIGWRYWRDECHAGISE